MSGLFNETIFNGEVFGKYVERVPNLKRNELLKSKALRRRDDLKQAMADQTGGNVVTTPLKGLIGGAPLNYDGKTDITATSTKTFQHTRVVVGRAKAWVEDDFSYDITGGYDPMENIAEQVAGYWDDVDQSTLVSILTGIFAMTGAKNLEFVNDHTTDITAEGDGKVKETTINTAMQKACGQNKGKFSLAVMHSVVATNLENLKLVAYMKYTDKDGLERELGLATVHGRLVLIDDSMPVEVEESTTKYTTFLLGDGALEYTDCGAKVPYEVDRDAKTNGGQDTLYSRQRKCFAPYGISFTNKSMASLSPTDAELQAGTNWSLVSSQGTTKEYLDHKSIPIARVISLG